MQPKKQPATTNILSLKQNIFVGIFWISEQIPHYTSKYRFIWEGKYLAFLKLDILFSLSLG